MPFDSRQSVHLGFQFLGFRLSAENVPFGWQLETCLWTEIRFRGRREVRAMLDGELNVWPHRLQSSGEAEMSGNKKVSEALRNVHSIAARHEAEVKEAKRVASESERLSAPGN